MREIKFRGWIPSQKRMFSAEEMAADQLSLLPTGQFINVHGGSTRLSKIYPVDMFVPMQYTGLKDRNSKEIYESDIVKPCNADNNQVLREVYWDNTTHQFRLSSCGRDKQFDKTVTLDFARIGVVIGNIYENPKLLKENSNG